MSSNLLLGLYVLLPYLFAIFALIGFILTFVLLFMPKFVRDLLVKHKFKLVNLYDLGEVYVKGIIWDYESIRLLKCLDKDSKVVYVTDHIRQAARGLGTIHKFKIVSHSEVKALTQNLKGQD